MKSGLNPDIGLHWDMLLEAAVAVGRSRRWQRRCYHSEVQVVGHKCWQHRLGLAGTTVRRSRL